MKENVMKGINLKLALFALVFPLGGFAAIDMANAKMVSGAELGSAIDACLLADDASTDEDALYFTCCSRSANICVQCSQPPSANKSCYVTTYRSSFIRGQAASPDAFNNQLMKLK